MDHDIKPIMEKYTSHWVLNAKLAKQLANFVKHFINLNEDHVEYFGGNLTGVHRVRFGTSERLMLTEDILDIDDLAIQREIKRLPHIEATWVRGTDGLNLALLYLVHKLAIDTSLSSKAKYDMQVSALLILQYKFVSSILTYYFKYLVKPEVALAVYQSLSGKYHIKKYKTWQAVFLARCHDILVSEDTHRKTIQTFEPDSKVQYMITDIQGRHKQMIINIYGVTIDIKESGNKVNSLTGLIELDGDLALRDITRVQNDYLNYIKKVAINKNEFIKEDLVEVIDSSITTMPRKQFYDVLLLVSSNAAARDKQTIELIEEIIFNSFAFFSENKKVVTDIKDLPNVLKVIKDLYTAGKSTNPSILKSRKIGEKIAKKATSTTSSTTISGLRTGLILYILLRALTKDHYS